MSTLQDRTKGVTILFKGQVMVTQQPVQADQIFLATASHWITKYKKDNPNG